MGDLSKITSKVQRPIVTLKLFAKNRLHSNGHISKGVKVNTLLDSGADISAVRESVAKHLQWKIEQTQVTATSANGVMPAVGEVRNTPIQISGVVKWVSRVVVFPDEQLPIDAILGNRDLASNTIDLLPRL